MKNILSLAIRNAPSEQQAVRGSSESSLGADFRRYIFLRYGSLIFLTLNYSGFLQFFSVLCIRLYKHDESGYNKTHKTCIYYLFLTQYVLHVPKPCFEYNFIETITAAATTRTLGQTQNYYPPFSSITHSSEYILLNDAVFSAVWRL